MASVAVLFLCVCIAVQTGDFAQVVSLCRDNERLLPCGGCQKTCDDPEPEGCSTVCRVGCYCPEGMVRNSTGECVKLEDCPSNVQIIFKYDTTEPRPNADCAEDEEYRFCENCNRTCENPMPICPAQCAKGCFCKGNMLRDVDGKCKEYEECSRIKSHSYYKYDPIPYRVMCGPYQRYNKCDCDRTCENPNPTCPKESCKKGCFCDPGFVKGPDGQCIRSQECPREKYVDPIPYRVVCGPYQRYKCESCERTCLNPNPSCPQEACKKGCFCDPGYVKGPGGLCMKIEECPKGTEEYY